MGIHAASFLKIGIHTDFMIIAKVSARVMARSGQKNVLLGVIIPCKSHFLTIGVIQDACHGIPISEKTCCDACILFVVLFLSIETATQRTSFLGAVLVYLYADSVVCGVINHSQMRLFLKSEKVESCVLILQRRYHCLFALVQIQYAGIYGGYVQRDCLETPSVL